MKHHINVDWLYDVGDVLINVSGKNPGDKFGGTWELFGSGKTLVGYNSSDSDFNKAEKTGGSKTHTMTIDELVQHNHNLHLAGGSTAGYNIPYNYNNNMRSYGGTDIIETSGKTKAFSIMQPYITVYFWKRVA